MGQSKKRVNEPDKGVIMGHLAYGRKRKNKSRGLA